MNKKIKALAFSFGIFCSSFAQYSWVNPAAIGSDYIGGDIFGISFTSASNGYISSYNHIYSTFDGGHSWKQVKATTSEFNPQYDIAFANASQGLSVGANSAAYTTNGGVSWTEVNLGASILNGACLNSSGIGYGVGNSGAIRKTSNFGVSWTTQTSGTTNILHETFFTSDTQGWAVGASGTILTTSNGGSTWTAQTSGTTQTLRSVLFVSPTEGYACGDAGIVLKTTNGGTNWTSLTSGSTQQLNDIVSISTTEFAICGANGTLLRSVDSGNTWTVETSGTTENLNAIAYSGSNLFSVGTNANILKNNSLSNWSIENYGVNVNLREVSKFNNEYIAVGLGGNILKSIDNGANWNKQNSGTTSNLFSVEMINSSISLAGGVSGTVLRTTNGGATWSSVSTGLTSSVNDIKSIPGAVFACDASGKLAKSTDQGASWTLIPTGSTGFQEMYWWDINNGIIIGTNSVALKTTNGGATWQNNPIPVSAFLKDVDFDGPNVGVVVGQNSSTFSGIIYKTLDGGLSWNALTPPASQNYNAVEMLSSTNYIAVSGDGFLSETTDGGTSFSTFNIQTSNTITDIIKSSTTEGVFVGDKGQIQLFGCTTVAPLIQENQTFCEGSILDDIVLSVGNPKWYTDEFLGIELPGTTVLSSSSTYYVTNNTGGCESLLSANFTPTIISTPSPTGAATQDFCTEGFVSDLTVSGASIIWYDEASNGNVLNFSDPLIDGTTLYASQTLNGCESLNLFAVDIVIYNPSVTGASQQSFCQGATIADISVSGQNIQWYDASSGGNQLSEIDPIQDGLIYYASATENGCEGINRLSVLASINPALNLGISEQLGVFSASANSMNYQWIDCNNGNQIIAGETNQQFTPSANGNYAVIINDGLCQDTSACLTITNVGINQTVHSNLDVYPNPTNKELFITNLSLIDSYEGSFEYQILTIEGKLILSGKLNSLNDKINVRSLNSGTYYLKLDGQEVPIKWIKN